MDSDKVAEYARLRRIQNARKAESEAAKAEADALQEQLIEEFVQAATSKITVDGTTVYLDTRIAANKSTDVDTETFHQALRDAGLEDFIKPNVNANTLAAYARELDANDEELPEPLREVLVVHHIPTLKTTPARRSASLDRLSAAS